MAAALLPALARIAVIGSMFNGGSTASPPPSTRRDPFSASVGSTSEFFGTPNGGLKSV